MKNKISKEDAKGEVEYFFFHIMEKKPAEIKKIKRLSMKYRIKLGDKKKLFCKKCFSPYKEASIRIKNDFYNIVCNVCGHKSRWKFKDETDLGSGKEVECC